jgi:hypothetical protein
MIKESTRTALMKTFKAIYKQDDQKELSYSLLGPNLSKATLSAVELTPRNTVLIKVFHNPDW